MTKTFNSTTTILGSSATDVYVASEKAMTLLIQLINTHSLGSATCDLWISDSSNNYITCLFPTQDVISYDGISDNGKHVILDGYKIRGKSTATNSVYVEVSTLEGL